MKKTRWIYHYTEHRQHRCLDCGVRSCCLLGLKRCTVRQPGPFAHRWQPIGKGRRILRHLAPREG